jgi:hypothetical protein
MDTSVDAPPADAVDLTRDDALPADDADAGEPIEIADDSSWPTADDGSWPCAACTFINAASTQRCECCHASQVDEYLALALTADPMSWICQSCTSANRKTREVCSVCHVGQRQQAEDAVRALTGGHSSSGLSVSTSSSSTGAPSTSTTPSHRSGKRLKGDDGAAADADADNDEEMPDSQPKDDEDDDDDDENDYDDPMEDIPTPKGRTRRIVKAKRVPPASEKLSYPAPYVAPAPSASSSSFSPAAALASVFGKLSSSKPSPPPAAAASSSSAKASLPCLTNEDSRAELREEEVVPFFAKYAQLMAFHRAFKPKDEQKEQQQHVSAAKKPNDKVTAVVQALYDDLQYQPTKIPAPSTKAGQALRSTVCTVCFTEFSPASSSDPSACRPAEMLNCGHASTCTDCFAQYVVIKIKDEAVMPWLCCPAPSCRHPLSPADLIQQAQLSVAQLVHLAIVYMRRRLVRSEAYVSCNSARNCLGGFHAPLVKGKPAKGKTQMCLLCDGTQMVERGKEGELDEEFKKMIAAGTLRPCPKCQHLTMKEKGVCNVLNCVKCAVWWNWRTKETVSSRMQTSQRYQNALSPVVRSRSLCCAFRCCFRARTRRRSRTRRA